MTATVLVRPSEALEYPADRRGKASPSPPSPLYKSSTRNREQLQLPSPALQSTLGPPSPHTRMELPFWDELPQTRTSPFAASIDPLSSPSCPTPTSRREQKWGERPQSDQSLPALHRPLSPAASAQQKPVKKQGALMQSIKKISTFFKPRASKISVLPDQQAPPTSSLVPWESEEFMYDPALFSEPCAASEYEAHYRSGPPVLMHASGSMMDWRADRPGHHKLALAHALGASPYDSCPTTLPKGNPHNRPVRQESIDEFGTLSSTSNVQSTPVNTTGSWGVHRVKHNSDGTTTSKADVTALAQSLSLPHGGLRHVLLRAQPGPGKAQAQVQYSVPNSPVPPQTARSNTYVDSKEVSQAASSPTVSHAKLQHVSSLPSPAHLETMQQHGDKQAAAAHAAQPFRSSQVLGVCQEVPAAMKRLKWVLDDYDITKRLYKGQTSSVYEATCKQSKMTVALKVYFLDRVQDNVMHMLRREVDLHIQLCHKNIAMLYAAFKDDKHIVLVQEFCGRGDLFGVHRKLHGRMPEAQVVDVVMRPFLEALDYLHTKGICHRDIKPENILFAQDWTLKLADFGVSIDLSAERAVTRTGTSDYMAPEVERCPLKANPEDNKDNESLAYSTEADMWSVGVLGYELLVGFPPIVTPKKNGAPAAIAEDDEEVVDRHSVATFIAEQANRHTLRFPASISDPARDFIKSTLAEFPGDRPTAYQLKSHAWLCK